MHVIFYKAYDCINYFLCTVIKQEQSLVQELGHIFKKFNWAGKIHFHWLQLLNKLQTSGLQVQRSTALVCKMRGYFFQQGKMHGYFVAARGKHFLTKLIAYLLFRVLAMQSLNVSWVTQSPWEFWGMALATATGSGRAWEIPKSPKTMAKTRGAEQCMVSTWGMKIAQT